MENLAEETLRAITQTLSLKLEEYRTTPWYKVWKRNRLCGEIEELERESQRLVQICNSQRQY